MEGLTSKSPFEDCTLIVAQQLRSHAKPDRQFDCAPATIPDEPELHWQKVSGGKTNFCKSLRDLQDKPVVEPVVDERDPLIVPAMSCESCPVRNSHRTKLCAIRDAQRPLQRYVASQAFFQAFVARPVPKKEIEADTTGNAKTARDKKWNNLRTKNVWEIKQHIDFRGWSDVASNARNGTRKILDAYSESRLRRDPNCR